MPRLPNVGDDSGTWGTVLNEYLGVSHTPDGKLMFEKWADASARPVSPTINQVGYNQDTRVIEQYDGADWVTLVGGIQNNVVDPAKLNNVKRTYDNFSLKSNGQTVEAIGTLPIVGSQYVVSINGQLAGSNTNPPYVENGALRPDLNLIYLGGEHTEDIESFTIEWEFFPTVNPTGIAQQGITFGFSAVPLFVFNGPGGSPSNLSLPLNMLHLQTTEAGPVGWGINNVNASVGFTSFSTTPSNTNWAPTGSIFGMPLNIRNFITIRIKNNDVTITGLGFTKIFRDARVSQGGTGKYWWIEWAGQKVYTSQMKIHRLWINSPHLDLAPGVNQPFSEILARLSSGGIVTLPQKINIGSSAGSDGSESLFLLGILACERFKVQPYANYGFFDTPHHTNTLSAPVSSSVNASVQTLGAGYGLFGLNSAGEREEFVIRGYFANNSNIKRLIIMFTAGTFFDSGDLTTSNKEWEIRLIRTFFVGTPYHINITFTIDGQNPILRFYSSAFGADAQMTVRATGVDAGDVVLRSCDSIKYKN